MKGIFSLLILYIIKGTDLNVVILNYKLKELALMNHTFLELGYTDCAVFMIHYKEAVSCY